MKRYKSEKARISKAGTVKIEVPSLAFLRELHGYGYFERHLLNLSYKKAFKQLRKYGGEVIAPSEQVATDIHKYYRIPQNLIHIN